MDHRPIIVWFRRDLRVADNPALAEAAAEGAVVPVFIRAPEEEGVWAPGEAARWWLRRSVEKLDEEMKRRGAGLVVRKGPSLGALIELTRETGARAVYWNRLYEPEIVARDKKIEAALVKIGVRVKTFNAALLVEPDEMRTKQGGAYRVFTPFWRELLNKVGESHFTVSGKLKFELLTEIPKSMSIGELEIDADVKFEKYWEPGEAGAQKRFKEFIKNNLSGYAEGRERPDRDATSRLSPHLHFGEIGPRRIWDAVGRVFDPTLNPDIGSKSRPTLSYLRQLAWREFAHHLLANFPETTDEPMRKEFKKFAWKMDGRKFEAWKDGRTGYPIVDAGMRQLKETGWMHNRVRMIAASFLVKDLMIPWQEGARWFWERLVDADLANNTLGWQWVAGCGADAAPFFRIFNPAIQAEKFDPEGNYIRRWIPEYGTDRYPKPIVDHRHAAIAALAAYRGIKTGRG